MEMNPASTLMGEGGEEERRRGGEDNMLNSQRGVSCSGAGHTDSV